MDSDGFSHGENRRRRHSFSSWHLRTISVNFVIDWKSDDLAWLYWALFDVDVA